MKRMRSPLGPPLALFSLGVALLLLGLGDFWLAAPHQVRASAGNCATSGPDGNPYQVTLCLTDPADGASISGVTPVTATVSVSGADPGVQRLQFSLDTLYLLTDFTAPYTFELPSDHYVDGLYTLWITATMRDGFVTTAVPQVSLTFSNGVTSPPVNNGSFTAYEPPAPPPGQPLLVAAVGDGASGETTAVTDLIASWDAGLFLYLGDVYDKGSYTEFHNWYGTPARYFGQFRDRTNPTIGNHEYEDGQAPGYFFYWDNVPNYYSFDTSGWHFISLNSNSQLGEFVPGTPQYDWLAADLAANSSACTVAFFHHPRFSIGSQGNDLDMADIWALLAQYGVDIVLAGHEHNYQRWLPVDGAGNLDPQGVTQLVVGGGGHGVRQFVTSDSRLAVGFDSTPAALGAMRLSLNPDGAAFQFVSLDPQTSDSGVIPCSGAPPDTQPPTAPANLTATLDGAGAVQLAWEAAYDNTGVSSYAIWRNGIPLTSTAGASLSFADAAVMLGSSYSYTVEALDLAGNVSAPSNLALVTLPPTMTLSISPVADSYVNAASPSTNYGSATLLRTDASPDVHSYLRFAVPADNGFVTGARLRLFANSGSSLGYTVHDVADDTWAEGGITYNNAPAAGSAVASSGPFAAGTWTEVDVSPVITGGGPASLALLTASNTNISYASREDATAPPQLLVDLSAASPAPPPAGIFTFNPVADTYVSASKPDRNYGAAAALRTDATPDVRSYLRFDVQQIGGFVVTATLRLFANSGSSSGYTVYSVADNTWDELATTYNNAPPPGSQAGSSGSFSSGTWTEVDVTSLVAGEGLLSLALGGNNNTATSYASREGANPPELVVVTSDQPPPPPEPGRYTFAPLADAYVNAVRPDRNYGGATKLRLDASPVLNGYLRFDVQGIAGTVFSATLRLYAQSSSASGYALHQVASSTWEESTLTYNNAPAIGNLVGSTGSFASNSWTEIDVTPVISGEGPVSLALVGASNTALGLSSKEGVAAPVLIVQTVAAAQAPASPAARQGIQPITPQRPEKRLPASAPPPAGSRGPAACQDSSFHGVYTVTACLQMPAAGALLAGAVPISATAQVTGSDPGVQRLISYLDGRYLLTDFTAPYTFALPTERFLDGPHTLSLTVQMRDGFMAPGPLITATFANGVTEPPVNDNTFSPYTATQAVPGQPLRLAVTGDGAGGRPEASEVITLVESWQPDMFLYLGDVYEQGTATEFYNWYGVDDRFFGRFRPITNPTIGNHEYDKGQAPGYFDYWDNIPHFYSFDAAGWHFASLDSTSQFSQTAPGSAQYDWLAQDLAASQAVCTIVFFHHPRFNVGSQGDQPRLAPIWSLLAQEGVDIVLAGHDHSYQRWLPLDGNGEGAADGMVQFVVGGGGHGITQFVRLDERLALGLDSVEEGYGALLLELNEQGASFRFANRAGTVEDSGVIPCRGAGPDSTPPTAPASLSASSDSAAHITLSWDPSNDNTGVASYTLYRNGQPWRTVSGASSSYVDSETALGKRYVYNVEASDAAGNRSPLSNPVQAQTAPTATLVLSPQADAYVDATLPESNFGLSPLLRADADPEVRSYLRFQVEGVVGKVQTATLRLFANSGSVLGYSLHQVTDGSWQELAITYNNAPVPGAEWGSTGPFNAGTWTEIDLTGFIPISGTLDLAVTTASVTNISLASRESGETAPQLVIETVGEPPIVYLPLLSR